MNRDVTYKDSLLSYISTMKIICPVLGIVMLILGIIEALDGYYLITALGVIGLVLMILITVKVNKKKTFSYMMEEDFITFKDGSSQKKYAYEDITQLVDDGQSLSVYSKDGLIVKLSSLEFEMADLAELVEECTDHKVPYKDIEGTTESHSRLPDYHTCKIVLAIFSAIELVSLILGMIGSIHSLVIGVLLTVIIPIISAVYYIGLTAEGQYKTIKDFYVFFFCTLIVSSITGWLVLFSQYAMENIKPLIYTTIIVFFIIMIYYRWLGEKAGLSRDALFTCFLIVFIPLALCWINDPIAHVTKTDECVIVSKEHYATKFSQVYHFNVKTGKTKYTYRATVKEFNHYQKGDSVTIVTKTGPFAVRYKEIKK